jgi:glycosyltransferase involved in cell wall biosynthesis
MLAVVRPHENLPIDFLEPYEPWAIPFQLILDDKPANVLGRKFVSLLDTLRCLSPACRHVLSRTSLFAASTETIARLEKVLSIEKPTAIVFVNFDPFVYPLALSLLDSRRPYGIIAHGCEIARLQKNKINDLVQRKTLLEGACWIAANSWHTKSVLLENWRIPPERIKILHPPISDEAMRESAALEPASRRDGALSLVTICRLVKGKGIDIVLRALKILSATGIPYRYAIAGDGPERGFLETLAVELGLRDKVQFMGAVHGEGKWRLLQNADVFVMPSRFDPALPWRESFGIAFAEAAAFGVPAAGSRSGGIPDAVIDGKTGLLVPEESPKDLADALTFFYRKPELRKEMGRAARERARKQFSPEAIATLFQDGFASAAHR